MGSPRKNGNTKALLEPFVLKMEQNDCNCEIIWLYDQNIQPCLACCSCQQDWTEMSCVIDDDLQSISERILESDLLVLATPVYSWYCTPPMKAALDRLVYGMNKYYGEEKGPALWKGKKVALITTCGYPPEKGADLLEEGIRRYCKHSQLKYLGMLVEHHLGYSTAFMSTDKEKNASEFARKLLESCRVCTD